MMSEQKNVHPSESLTSSQQEMVDLWDEHVKQEFVTHNVEATLETMVENPYVITIPVPNGGVGNDGVREYYSKHFIPQIPSDTEMTPISRTVGSDRIVDEVVLKFTHTIEMDWLLPGIPPTGKRVELPVVAVIHFKEGKIAHEHIYWDQASVLVQAGLIDVGTLPVAGVESAQQLLGLTVGRAG
jgi:carboxymethylenebutenolidase